MVGDVGRDGLQGEDADLVLGGAVLGDQVAAGTYVAAPGLGGDAVRGGAGLQLSGRDVGAGADLGDRGGDDSADRLGCSVPGALKDLVD
ncbi:hypothetical protein ACIG5E_38745 [Kitasatospora sp. NPDC053057]|uniref:hypothetical protein n=1 Tax=Kitasatospora sp. NPDC053057 TaxID=3364062 RepID=UPI0037C93FC4